MNKPFFSIIIPSLNEEINLPVLLLSIQNQTLKDYEVIVVDSGSKDKTKENTQKFKDTISQFSFIERPCKNVSMARNYGASKAKGEFLVFFDADVEVEPVFLEQIKKNLDEYKLDATTVWNRSKHTSVVGTVVLTLLNVNMSLFQNIKPAANGPCIIMRKSLFDTVGFFDEQIVFGEDFDLIQRAHKKQAEFKVFRKPILYVSTRRFEKEGFFISLYKSLKALLYQLIIGPIRKPIFEYEMGGQYYKK